jgi:hypothetical protein
VLAAVAVLGFTIAMLARGAIQGMRYEGDASRRLTASLIADRALFEVESALAIGTLPQVGRQEREEDEFRLALEVAPVDPVALGVPFLFTGPGSEPSTRASAAPGQTRSDLPTLLLVNVRVAWTEGLVEQSVTRTTFAYDATATARALGAAEASAESAAAAETSAPPVEEEEQEP